MRPERPQAAPPAWTILKSQRFLKTGSKQRRALLGKAARHRRARLALLRHKSERWSMKRSEFPTSEDIEAALARARRARSDALGSLIFRALTGRPAELLLFDLFACLLAAAVFSEP